MIRIDHISFDFTAPDEAFAHRLYANWDGFCHRCFERVAEECLASYGDDRMLHELERLDLDLGNIPEEDFYSEFPRRLKEVLTNALPPLHALQIQTDPEITAASRKKNLFFYLEHGHPLPEWADGGFDPQEEAAWLMNRSTASCHAFIREAAVLCLKREYALRRLLCQTNDDALFLYLYAATLAEPSAGLREKRRLLALLLEERPDIPVRFVHETGDEDKLREMSVLLDTLSVRGIIQTETKEHAEVDLPPYWHYLYEWLVRYYPYNGIAIFGGKEEFIRHLHHRLLTFIHKRDGASYLSKTELTVGFLLEVFGAAYYKNVLNAIYLLQPHNPDGSPVYDSYFNRELYRMFLRLSLLHLPEAIKEGFTTHEDKQNGIALPANDKDFTTWLTDTSQSLTIKRMLLATLVKEQPEVLVRWLQAEAIQDGTLLFLLAELADDAILYQLITSFSFAASETAKAVQAYLEKHELGTSRLKGLSEPHLAQAFRRSAFRWLANGGNNAETLLRMVYRELAGKEEDDAAVETLARRIKEMQSGEETGKETADIRHLQTILANPMLSDTIKRRTVAHFWDNYREDYVQAMRLLQEYELLSETVRLTSRNAWTELVRRMAMQVFGKDAASGILSLIEWLTAREDKVSGYLTESSLGIRNGMLLWFAHQGQDCPGMSPGEAARSLLTFLFGKENARLVLRQIVQESASGSEDAEQVWGWLENTVANEPRALQTTYKKWKHCHEGASDTLRTLFESRRHTAEDFAGWLNDTSQTIYEKRELLREAATGNPSEWLRLLRALPEGSTALASLRGMLASQDLLGSIAQANFHQATVLSRVMERLHHPTTVLPVSLTGGIPLETFLRSALLAYLRDPEALGRTLSEREITDRFLSYLRLAATGKGHDEPDAVQWRQLAESVADTQSGNVDESLVRRITGRPDELLAWLEQEADKDGISRLAVLSDGLTAGHWADCLAAMPGFAYPDAFRQLTAWLLRRMPVRELVPILFLYVKEPGWRTFTPEQMEMYFFSRLYGKTHALPTQETLADENLPEAIRKRLFRRYLRHRPDQLLAFIRKTVLRNTMPLGRWLEWTDASDWLQLAASLSLAKAELLWQVTACLSLPEAERHKALAVYIIYGDTESWPYDTPRETIRDFIDVVPSMWDVEAGAKEKTVRQVEKELGLPEERPIPEKTPEVLTIGNAGLCLLAPWFVRLFAMLGYLDENKRQFRNKALKVRAVFLLQYLVFGKERRWRETELAFNRLLTALPGHVPLPHRLRLTGREKKTADGMVAGVKANWPQMNGTSAESFRQSFLVRRGWLERQDERWLLSVEERAYDLLLDTVPWGFRQIRLPWMKKHVQVKWQDKQTF